MPSATATDVVVPLSNFTDWSAKTAAEVVGMQWQFTGTNVDIDAGAGCAVNVSITNIKFLP